LLQNGILHFASKLSQSSIVRNRVTKLEIRKTDFSERGFALKRL